MEPFGLQLLVPGFYGELAGLVDGEHASLQGALLKTYSGKVDGELGGFIFKDRETWHILLGDRLIPLISSFEFSGILHVTLLKV